MKTFKGGKFGNVSVWNNEFEKTFNFNLGEISAGLENSYIRSVSYSNQNILIGTAQSEVLILNNENNEAGDYYEDDDINEVDEF